MDTRALIFDIQRTDDADWLTELRGDVAANECYSDDDRAEINAAVDQRFSQLNRLNAGKRTEGNEVNKGK